MTSATQPASTSGPASLESLAPAPHLVPRSGSAFDPGDPQARLRAIGIMADRNGSINAVTDDADTDVTCVIDARLQAERKHMVRRLLLPLDSVITETTVLPTKEMSWP